MSCTYSRASAPNVPQTVVDTFVRADMDEVFEVEQRLLRQNDAVLDDLSLANLRKYKYSSLDLSPTSKYILGPWWNYVATWMPSWLAPNCITLLGISAIILNIAFIHHYAPDLETQMPTWVYYWSAFSLFFYQTMDNVDGKQARKTGTSSPLGELFDHGIDSLNCTLSGYCCVASVGLGSSLWGFLLMICTTGAMYFSTWETYYTRTLFLGFLNGPTEGLLITCGVHLTTAWFGVAFWQNTWIFGLRYSEIWTVIALLGVVFGHAPACIVNVSKALREREGNTVTLGQAMCNLRPYYIFAAAFITWAASPYSIMLKDNYMLTMCWVVAFTFGRQTTFIILSHLCHQPFPRNSILLVLACFGSLVYGVLPYTGLSVAAIIPESFYLKSLLVFSSVYFFFYSRLIIDKLCAYLGISAFTVPSRNIS